ncbi:MAG: hypothetical protein KBD66_01485 [Candidatus Doudnabacteria bacterium]|nr:hypothetical protein [Candidatus Doudnabacteria bacterium]
MAKIVVRGRPGCTLGQMVISGGQWVVVPAALAVLFQAPAAPRPALRQVKRHPEWGDAQCPHCYLRQGDWMKPAPLGETKCQACHTMYTVVA